MAKQRKAAKKRATTKRTGGEDLTFGDAMKRIANAPWPPPKKKKSDGSKYPKPGHGR